MNAPQAIELTDTEQQLLALVDFRWTMGHSHNRRLEIFEAAHDLTLSLLQRRAIPEHRWAYFTDPQHKIGSKKSWAEIFASNGTSGDEIFRHPHFVKFLRYFLYGPNLPESTTDGFGRLIGDCAPFTSGDIDQVCAYAKAETRSHKLDRKSAADDFYKLALECGLDGAWARMIRDSVFRLR